MLTQSYDTGAAAKRASGPDTGTPGATLLWARLLCGLAAIAGLFPALCARLPNRPCNVPSDPNAGRTTVGEHADAPAKDNPDDRDVEDSVAAADGTAASDGTAAADGSANGKTAPSKSGRSAGKGKTGNGKAPARRGKGKNRGRQTERPRKAKSRGGKAGDKAGDNGKNGPADAGPDADDATPKGIMKMLAGGLCLAPGLRMLDGLGVAFSDSPRAVYGLPDMYRMLVSMSCGSKESATAEGQYEESKDPGRVRLPSRSWLLKKLGEVRHDHTLKRCRRMLRRTVLHAKRRGMLRRPVVVAIDEHDIPFHAKIMRMKYAIFSRGKKGTIRFNRMITVFCVVDGQRFTLDAEVVRRKSEQAAVVGRLLERCRASGVMISAVLMDRGYFSTGVMERVREAGHPMLMPAVKHDPVKDMIRKFDAGELDAISAHTISSGDRSESFRLVILRRQKAERGMSAEARALLKLYERQVRVEDEYYVFATTMSDSWIHGDPGRAAELYKMRRGIENSYKSYEQLRPWTTSNSHSVRILLWYIPFVLYNLWMLARHITGRRTGITGGRPPLPLHRFVSYMLAILTVEARSGRPPD